MRTIGLIFRLVFALGVIYGAVALTENSFDPGKWHYDMRAVAAMYMVCLILLLTLVHYATSEDKKGRRNKGKM
jgi:hypothetical protein